VNTRIRTRLEQPKRLQAFLFDASTRKWEIRTIASEIRDLQRHVQGYIEIVRDQSRQGFLWVVNDEGAIRDLPYAFPVNGSTMLRGNVIGLRDDQYRGDFISITEDDERWLKGMFGA